MKTLEERIKEKGKPTVSLFLGISETSLNNKLSGRTEFTIKEANKLVCLLNLNNSEIRQLFFNQKVSKTLTIGA